MRRFQASSASTTACISGSMPLPGETGERHHRRALDLRQQARGLLLQLLQEPGPVGDEVPFVEADDERAALLLDEVDDRQILLLERDRGVEEHHDHLGEAHGAQGVGDRELLELVVDPRALAQARGIEQPDRPAAPAPVEGDRVAGDARLGAGQEAVLARACG